MELAACASCRRHVRVEETSCPFCGTSIESVRLPDVVVGRISRGELLTIIATLGAGALIGCDKKDDPGNLAEVYGAPPRPPKPSASASTSAAPSSSSSPPDAGK